MAKTKPCYYALVPAAGRGERMRPAQDAAAGAAALPKQYLPLAGKPLIYHALAALCAVSRMRQVFVVLAPDDTLWQQQDWSALKGKITPLFCGGATRAQSVAAGLASVAAVLKSEDWVLVHDAARPCLEASQVDLLIDAVGAGKAGGILALPVADTLKQDDGSGRIAATIGRERMWLAQTPQMFPYGALRDALHAFPDVTDEAGAIERFGLRPLLVASSAANFKVTQPADLKLAAAVLASRAGGAGV